MKYCCDNFELRIKFPNTTSPNIRIVKFEPIPKAGVYKSHYGFFITMGYEKFSLKLPMLNISFCPFCGTYLKKFYNSDQYCNEFEGKTFIDE
jgi:hypothetical protein